MMNYVMIGGQTIYMERQEKWNQFDRTEFADSLKERNFVRQEKPAHKKAKGFSHTLRFALRSFL